MPGKSLVPPPLPGLVYALTQEVVFLQQKCQFSHYYRSGAPVDATKVAADYNAIKVHWTGTVIPALQPCLSVGTLLANLRIWCMVWPGNATGVFDTGGLHGTVAGDPLPPQVAGVLSKRTGLRGSSGRGRMYLCGISEDSSTNGAPIPAFTTAMTTLGGVLSAPFIDGGTTFTYTPVVVSLANYAKDRLVNPPPDGQPPFIPKVPPITVRGGDITQIVADIIWYTQRRRTFGKGQ